MGHVMPAITNDSAAMSSMDEFCFLPRAQSSTNGLDLVHIFFIGEGDNPLKGFPICQFELQMFESSDEHKIQLM